MQDPSADEYAEDEHRQEVYANARKEVVERMYSNAEAFDKAILTLSTALLALSVTFIKDLLPPGSVKFVPLLYSSWACLTLAIVATVISFRVSDAALARQLTQIERYYVHRDETALIPSKLSRAADTINNISGFCFISGMLCTVLFAALNFSETRSMSKSNDRTGRTITHDGQTVPTIQQVSSDYLKKGQTIPNIQPIPSPAKSPSAGTQSPTANPTNTAPTAPVTKK